MESPTESPLPRPPDSSESRGSLRADTTAEQDRKTAGQRSVNRQWEFWQGFLAVMVIGGFVYTACIGKESPALAGLAGSIVTFYYVRTNHTKIGGVGGTDSR
jgi:hypothetical protein